MKTSLLALLFIQTIAVCSCSKNFFTSESTTRPAARKVPDTLSDDFVNGEQCGASGKTEAELISKSIMNGQSDNQIVYKVTLSDCNGKPKALEAKYLLFDINALLKTYHPKGQEYLDTYEFPFSINGQNNIQGKFTEHMGQDLFGRSGETMFHWRNEVELSFTKEENEFEVIIDLQGLTAFPSDIERGYIETLDDEYQIDTYLRLGAALPVRVTVPFINENKEEILEKINGNPPLPDDTAEEQEEEEG